MNIIQLQRLSLFSKNRPHHDDQRERLNNICQNHPICKPLFRLTLALADIHSNGKQCFSFVALYGYCVSQNGGGGNGNCNSNQVYYNGQCYTKVGLGYACNANVPGMCTNNGICTGGGITRTFFLREVRFSGFCQCPNGYYYQYSSQWCIPNGSTNPCPQNQV